MIKKLSTKDKKDWENFVKSNEKIYNKDLSSKKNYNRKISTKTIDLHGFTLEKANEAVGKYIKRCYFENVKTILKNTPKIKMKIIKRVITIKTKYYLKAERKRNKINSLMFLN